MPSLNKVMLMGNLTRDPELRVTPKGTPICQFGLAINRTFKLESGETREEVTFVDVEAWGKQGETIAKYLTKGKPMFVEGRLKLDQWEDKGSGEKRSKLKIVLEQFQFIGGKDDAPAKTESPPEERHSSPRQGSAPPARNAPPSRAPAPRQENLDEDVPF
jgi:single-strand DNA-binding protein